MDFKSAKKPAAAATAVTPTVELFQKVRTKCPVCENDHTYSKLRPHLFAEQNFDIDMHPQTIQWSASVVDQKHPPLYYMWHCPHCHFTGGHATFEDPVKDCSIKLNMFRRRLKTLFESDPKVQRANRLFSEGVDLKNPDYFAGVLMHMLAIYQLSLLDEITKKDALALGRYYLRLAWLFREIFEDDYIRVPFYTKFDKILVHAKEAWPEMPLNEKICLERAVTYYMTGLENSYAVQTATEEVKIVLLICRINIKLENFTEARKFFMRARDRMSKYEQARQQKVREVQNGKLELSQEKLSEMSAESTRIRNMVEQAQIIIEDYK